MLKFQGIPASSGIAICDAFVVSGRRRDVPQREVVATAVAVDTEVARLHQAVRDASTKLAQHRDVIERQSGKACADIFDAHLQILNDPKLSQEFESRIRSHRDSAASAVQTVMAAWHHVFQHSDNRELVERTNDLVDIERYILDQILGGRGEQLENLRSPVVLLAANLTPSETASLNRTFVKGFVTEQGGQGGHTAIVAAAFEIPAVVGVGAFLAQASVGDTVIVDGYTGNVIIRPDDETLARYRRRQDDMWSRRLQLNELTTKEAVTLDQTRIHLYGNIEFPFESQQCLDRGADGVGLFRTEFLYLTAGEAMEVSESQHLESYREVAAAMHGRPVTIRTCDLGSDKISDAMSVFGAMSQHAERNPALGLRSIRLSLKNVSQFAVQLRAILRASVAGNIRVMFPMVTTLAEWRAAKMILADVQDDLHEAKIPFDADLKVGMMIEVPAAVLMLDRFVQEVDFVSIGTNDLVQYTLAVDRGNSEVSYLFHAEDPAVLRLVQQTVAVADAAGVPVCLCGQMASNPIDTPLLIGLGLRELSCAPQAIHEVKEVCRSVTLTQCQQIVREVMEMENAFDIRTYLRECRREIFPHLAIY